MPIIRRNFEAFEDFKERLDEAARGELLPKIAKRVGAAFIKQVADEFRESRDPYGNPWAPVFRDRPRDRRARASRVRRGLAVRADKPLIDTGRLRASPVAIINGTQVRIVMPVDYASYHQYGTRKMVRRQMLPEEDTGGLGDRWSMAVNTEVAKVMLEHFGAR